jgi:Arc/MetJ-type ribon-helix-helix transcriptional regulator
MKTLRIELPDALAERLQELVKAGWFTSEEEIGGLALEEFVGRRRYELQEQHQREDVAWAVSEARRKKSRPEITRDGAV